MQQAIKIVGFSLSALVLTACSSSNSSSETETPQQADPIFVMDTLTQDARFSQFTELLIEANLDQALADPNEHLTLFAPTNAALDTLSSDELHTLTEGNNLDILRYHLIRGERIDLMSASTLGDQRRTTESGQELMLTDFEGKLFVNASLIDTQSLVADNGIVHPINRPLQPPANDQAAAMNLLDTLRSNPEFESFVEELEKYGLAEQLTDDSQSWTVIAPTHDGLPRFPADSLQFLAQEMTEEELAEFVTEAMTRAYGAYLFPGEPLDALTGYSLAGSQLESVNGIQLAVTLDQDGWKIGTSTIVNSNIYATNGVIHVVVAPLLPQSGAQVEIEEE